MSFRTFTDKDWQNTPEGVRNAFENLEQYALDLKKKYEKSQEHLNKNSRNSSLPPSSDKPFKKNTKDKKPAATDQKRRPGAKKGHEGHRQKLLESAKAIDIFPTQCTCGNCSFPETKPFYTHQEIELPKIKMDVKHFVLHKGVCPSCGMMNKGVVPQEHRTGFGPRLSAFIGELAGGHGNSRTSIQDLCSSVFDFHLSLGAIQKIIDRVSVAIHPHYEEIGNVVRTSESAYVDETSYPQSGDLAWLWVMATSFASLFMIHSNRSKEAFLELILDWQGILISDGYGVYKKWANARQTCLAHLIRTAQGLSENANPEIAKCGKWAKAELQRLCKMANSPPSLGEWSAFYARFIRLTTLYCDRKDAAGQFARRLQREMENLWVFLHHEGVAPTNNHAERMLRFAVLWRKRSQGTRSDKGERWVERVLSLRQTCRLQKRSTYDVLVDAVRAYFKEQSPDLSWISSLQ